MADVGDDRGLSTATGYAMSLGVTVLLVSGLLAAAGGFATDQRSQAIRSEFEVIGQRVASDVMTADRLATESDGGIVRVNTYIPVTVAGTPYTVRIVANDSQSVVVLHAESPDVTVTTPFRNRTRVESTTIHGGTLVFRYNGTMVEVRDDE